LVELGSLYFFELLAIPFFGSCSSLTIVQLLDPYFSNIFGQFLLGFDDQAC